MRELITFRVFDAGSKTEFTNNSLKSPKIGKLNIDIFIIPQGLLIHEKKPDQKISCYCPFKQRAGKDLMTTNIISVCMYVMQKFAKACIGIVYI